MIPFLKWPGGKRWFVARHADLLPTTFGRYFEPFLGGASVFFHLRPSAEPLLADCSTELMAVYSTVAWRRKQLESLLLEHHVESTVRRKEKWGAFLFSRGGGGCFLPVFCGVLLRRVWGGFQAIVSSKSA